MKAEWLIRNQKQSLILFFAGWGMDINPFVNIGSRSSDVLMFCDYRNHDVPLSLSETCKAYDSVTLIAWSLGVPVAQLVCSDADIELDNALAVNGTLFPADDKYGIPESVFDGTVEALSPESLLRFYRRMCGSRKLMDQFMTTAPERSIDDLGAELRALRSVKASEGGIYDAAIVGSADRIVPPENQVNCWEKHGVPVHSIVAPHFPFHLYAGWEDLIEEGKNDG